MARFDLVRSVYPVGKTKKEFSSTLAKHEILHRTLLARLKPEESIRNDLNSRFNSVVAIL